MFAWMVAAPLRGPDTCHPQVVHVATTVPSLYSLRFTSCGIRGTSCGSGRSKGLEVENSCGKERAVAPPSLPPWSRPTHHRCPRNGERTRHGCTPPAGGTGSWGTGRHAPPPAWRCIERPGTSSRQGTAAGSAPDRAGCQTRGNGPGPGGPGRRHAAHPIRAMSRTVRRGARSMFTPSRTQNLRRQHGTGGGSRPRPCVQHEPQRQSSRMTSGHHG